MQESGFESDRLQIERLMNEYCYAIDDGRFEVVAAMFEDAQWGIPGRFVATSGAEVLEFMQRTPLYDGRPRTRHVLTNITIDISGDEARALSYAQLLRQQPGGPIEIAMAGNYEDRFRRVGDRWRFTHKLSSPELVGQLPGLAAQGASRDAAGT